MVGDLGSAKLAGRELGRCQVGVMEGFQGAKLAGLGTAKVPDWHGRRCERCQAGRVSGGRDSENPFVVIVDGLPFLSTRLKLNHIQPLAQRIIVHYKMEPLDKPEVFQYINHRLKLAGATAEVFSQEALEAIASHSAAWPRLINNLASTSLLLGAQLKKNPIDAEVVRLASMETNL